MALFNFKGKASFEWEFESDVRLEALIENAIDGIRDELSYLGELKNMKVTIKKGKQVEDRP